MNRKILYSILLGSLLLLGTSCLNYDDLIPENYNKILLLKETGVKDITLYNTGEDGNYEFTILKAGNNPMATAQAEVKVLSEAELALHSQSVGADYKLLPSSVYELKDGVLSFAESQQYLHRNIVLKTSLIDELLLSDPSSNYVLPVRLISTNDSVNTEKDLVILRPRVVTPVVAYHVNSATLNVSGESSTYQLYLELPFVSLWDFEVSVVVDPDAVPAGYSLVPSNLFTIENEGKVQFKTGSRLSEPLNVKVDNSNLFGASFVIPFKVTSTSMAGFDFPSDHFLLNTAFNKIQITEEMLSTNAQESYEGPIANLIDNNPASFFHTAWSYAIADAHYFQVKLPTAISRVQFTYQNRINANGKPQDFKILVSDNGTNWTELTRIDTGLPTDPGSTYTSSVLNAAQPFSYFRFEVHRTNSGSAPTFFNMAEFSMYGK